MSNLDLLKHQIARERDDLQPAPLRAAHDGDDEVSSRDEWYPAGSSPREKLEVAEIILRTAGIGFLVLDAVGKIEAANRESEAIFGYPSRGLAGRMVGELFRQDDTSVESEGPSAGNRFWTSSHDAPPCTRDVVGHRRDGEPVELEVTGSRVEWNGQRRHIWVVRDVTSQRQLQRQLQASHKMESVGQLAAGVAHEINTPVQYVGDNLRFLRGAFASVRPLLETARMASPTPADSQTADPRSAGHAASEEDQELGFLLGEIPTAIDQALEGIQRVGAIVQAMKEFSHPGTVERTAIDLNRAVECTLEVSQNEWKRVACVQTDLQRNLPRVPGYPTDLNQALLNLIVNAAQALSQRDAAPEDGWIRICTRQEGEYVELTVSDNGCGIPETALDRVFDPFFTTKPPGAGTGQGLAVVYTVIVQRHAGTLDVTSRPGHGTQFTIRLPLRPTPSALAVPST